jgi:hypothetical protein
MSLNVVDETNCMWLYMKYNSCEDKQFVDKQKIAAHFDIDALTAGWPKS